MKLLPEEIYNFLGSEIAIRSNSEESLSHLRAVYGRFYQYSVGDSDEKIRKPSNRTSVEILDKLSTDNELTINDSFLLYRMSMENGSYKWSGYTLPDFSRSVSGMCHPLHLIQTVILSTIMELITNYHLFHAGVVERNGKGIILAADPDMGKSTLTLKLVMEGCKFLSDEIACINPSDNTIAAFPRRLSIRDESRKLLGLSPLSEIRNAVITDDREWMLDIEDIVPGSLAERCTPCFIFFLRGFGETPRLERVSGSNALFMLMGYTYSYVSKPSSLLFQCAGLMDSIQCYNLVIGDVDKTARLIIEKVDKDA